MGEKQHLLAPVFNRSVRIEARDETLSGDIWSLDSATSWSAQACWTGWSPSGTSRAISATSSTI